MKLNFFTKVNSALRRWATIVQLAVVADETPLLSHARALCHRGAAKRPAGSVMRIEPKTIGRLCKNALVFTALLSALLTFSGCASSRDVFKPASPVVTGKPISMDNIFVVITSSAGDLAAERKLLGDAIISGLMQTEMFTSVTGNPADLGSSDDIKVAVDIKAIKKVSNNAREWVGGLAGRARILVRVTITDLKSGNPIEVFEAEGQSGASAFAGTTNEAIQNVVQPVVAEALRLNAQSAQ